MWIILRYYVRHYNHIRIHSFRFQKQITITAVHAKITYTYYMIQRGGGRHIDFRQMSISGADYG